MDHNPWRDWVGKSQETEDDLYPLPARALAATLDRQGEIPLEAGDPLPPLWTWLYFLQIAPMTEVGPDGHPKRGGFLPPIEYPRRMWAGSRCAFHAPVPVGQKARKVSTIKAITEKSGKAGPMVFVTVAHEIHAGGVLAMREEQDIVYMEIPAVFRLPDPLPLPDCDWTESVDIDPVFLFRFSALTFNGHRIHYDRIYASDVEKYPGLVVHGPLQAVLLFDAACRNAPGRTPSQFDFRGVRPLFDHDEVTVGGVVREDDGLDVFTANAEGAISMKATMKWAGPG